MLAIINTSIYVQFDNNVAVNVLMEPTKNGSHLMSNLYSLLAMKVFNRNKTMNERAVERAAP